MKLFIGLTVLALAGLANASDLRCINKEEAIAAASSNIEVLRADIHQRSHLWVPRARIQEFVNGLEFVVEENKYVSGIITRWTCAPGADCYAGVEVSCDSQATIYEFAD